MITDGVVTMNDRRGVRMKDIFSNIDWPLFEKQKAAFVETIYGTPMSPEHQELLEGLLYAIDHFQDCAEDAGFDAFPTLNKED